MITEKMFRKDAHIAQLSEIVIFLDNLRKPITEKDRNIGIYPYYGANGIQGWIDEYIFDEELVLLAEDGGHFNEPDRGIAYKITGKTWVNNHAHVLKATEKVDTNYLVSALKNLDVTTYINGTTRAKLTKSNAEQIKIPLPPISEQKRIAAILDKADEIRRKREQAIAKLEQLAQSIFVEMFGDINTNNKNWKKLPLQKVCEVINDCPHSTPKWTNEGYVALRTSNLTAGSWKWDDKRFVSEETYYDRSKRGFLEYGDIVLSREGTIGIAAIVPKGVKYCMGQRLVQVRVSKNFLTASYLLRHLLCVLAPEKISNVMVGSTSQHLNVKELRELPIPLPPLALQEEFAKRINQIEKLKADNTTALANHNALFASLQQQAFSGNL